VNMCRYGLARHQCGTISVVDQDDTAEQKALDLLRQRLARSSAGLPPDPVLEAEYASALEVPGVREARQAAGELHSRQNEIRHLNERMRERELGRTYEERQARTTERDAT